MIKLVILLLIPCSCGAGQFLDEPDLGNNSYLNARYLNHTTGRFLTQDDKKQFKSHYLYGNGDVIKKSDPSGNIFGDFFRAISSVSSVETRSAMDILVRESTTIVIPIGGSIDTKLVVRDSNNVIVSRQYVGMVDDNIPPPSYESLYNDIFPPSYDFLYGEEESIHTRTETPLHTSTYERTVRSRVHRDSVPTIRRGGNETEIERTERLLRDFENRVGIFSENHLPAPRHHNYYNGVTSPYGDSLEYTLFDFLNNIPNYDSPVDSD